jgi:putative ABC transport system substrate-binding protein
LIGTGNDLQGQFWLVAFRRRLQELGWPDGRDLQIDVRWGSADLDHIRSSAADLVSSKPDALLVYGVRSLNPIREATRQIPVVFIATSDPVGLGFVESLARPGGNLTGFMLYEVSLAGKLLSSCSRTWYRISSALLWSSTPTTQVRRAIGAR